MIDALPPRKFSLLRKAWRKQRAVIKSADIHVDGLLDQRLSTLQPLSQQLLALQSPRVASDIHFLPLPSRLAQLLPQAEPQATLLDRSKQTTISTTISTTILKVELDTLKKDLHAEIDLCNAELVAFKDSVLAMEEEIACVQRRVFRLKTLAVGGMVFLIVWAFALNLLL